MTVTIYTKDNCPPCMMVKRLLASEGIAFDERDAVEHADYLASIGARSAPVIVDGDTVIHGFVPEQLRRLGQ